MSCVLVVGDLAAACQKNGIIRSPLNVNFVGLDNYADVINDPTFRKAAANTALYVLITTPLVGAVDARAARRHAGRRFG